ncbi:major facilitator superfamily domain-containing protein [Aspergillus venezuelensis]
MSETTSCSSPSSSSSSSSSSTESLPKLPPTDPAPEPYHILTTPQKWNLVIFVSLAACFSPLSSNIYFPALSSISTDLHISTTLTSLTITIYMVVQGLAPSLFSPCLDAWGRRITFGICLSIYTVANLALAFTSSYAMIMVLRGIQAAGSAATISIAAGVIGDIATPRERGGFMGTNAGVRMMGQAIGPVIGGLLNSRWGFRSIFWLLFVLAVIVLFALLVFLPETHRRIAGDGSVRLYGIHKPLIYSLNPPRAWSDTNASKIRDTNRRSKSKASFKSAFSFLTSLFEKDIAALLAWGAISYTAWSTVTSSTTPLLLEAFPFLTQWRIGLCFLPNGLGCILGSLSTGWLLNQSFARAERSYKAAHGIPSSENLIPGVNDTHFPYIKARMRLMPLFSAILLISLSLYGPSFEFRHGPTQFIATGSAPDLAAPLVLQFIIGYSATAIFNVNSTVLVDLFPGRPAGATALNNLVRCLVGAAGVAGIEPLIECLGVLRGFLVVTGVVGAFLPLVWVAWRFGEGWRGEREERGRLRKEEEKEKERERERESVDIL